MTRAGFEYLLREHVPHVAKAMGLGVTSSHPAERNAKGGEAGGEKRSTPPQNKQQP